jgi:hypothetical protein
MNSLIKSFIISTVYNLLMIAQTTSFAFFLINKPHLSIKEIQSHHTFSVLSAAKQNHPTYYENRPKFLGPLVLSQKDSTSDNRVRIRQYYLDEQNGLELPKEAPNALAPNASTDLILKTIVDHFAFHDAPVDAKEVAESIEFFLRTRKRLMGAAKKRHAKNLKALSVSHDNTSTSCSQNNDDCKLSNEKKDTVPRYNTMNVALYDMCAGHGLTGMLFAACNPPTNNGKIVKCHLVDIVQPPSHAVLKGLISDICPWIESHKTIIYHNSTLESFSKKDFYGDASSSSSSASRDSHMGDCECSILIATHACGSLTDQALEKAVELDCCSIAVMPCCYTGADKGVPYGFKRAFGTAWAADIRRTYFLDSHHFHTDYSSIPQEITPLNRIIVAEDRS